MPPCKGPHILWTPVRHHDPTLLRRLGRPVGNAALPKLRLVRAAACNLQLVSCPASIALWVAVGLTSGTRACRAGMRRGSARVWRVCVALLLARSASASLCASSWITEVGAGVSVAVGTEYLPPPNASVAWMDTRQEAAVYTLARLAWRDGAKAGAPPMHFDEGETIGKHVHIAAAEAFGRLSRGEAFSVRPPFLPAAASRWASRVAACNQTGGAWECLFGTNELPPSDDDGCDRVWRAGASPDRAAAVVIAGAVAAALAPDPRFDARVVHVRHEVSAPERWGTGAFIAVHVRRGDACDIWVKDRPPFQRIFWLVYGGTRRPCFAWPLYERELLRLSSLYNVSNALILSEDRSVIDEAVASLRGSINTMWLEYDRTHLAHGHGFIEARGDTDESVVLSALAAMHIARNAVALVGHFYSHFTKALYLLMAGHHGVAPPWISMDGGGLRSWDAQNGTLADGLADIY